MSYFQQLICSLCNARHDGLDPNLAGVCNRSRYTANGKCGGKIMTREELDRYDREKGIR